jgi:hypothetical protein
MDRRSGRRTTNIIDGPWTLGRSISVTSVGSYTPKCELMDDVVRNIAATSDPLHASLAAVSDDSASGDDALTSLVRRVLLAALELREGRRKHEEEQRGV